ncbi:uncharacterized protein LOC110696167 [Chenopodium quinoa]|uniref:uncharacterized protein LOC110696167 n=1 Tax=Chenopodium quinoa TaxID=63459 RepID=UPI000B797C5C|nr:uncharacterized protein LOC110696167 [Chenopodium quinoa]
MAHLTSCQTIVTTKHVGAIICLIVSSMLLGGVLGNYLSQHHVLTLKVALALISVAYERKPKGIGLKHGGCPSSTVPILRTNVQDPDIPRPSFVPGPLEHCVAVIQTNIADSNKKFFGSSASMTLYKPRVQKGQWSSSRIKLSNGVDSIEAGWMVNPTLFNDNDAHFYARSIVGQKECLNQCDNGFVQVSKAVPLGTIPDEYSEIGGDQHTWKITIRKHIEDDNWCLIIFDKDGVSIPVGYWPKGLFTSLVDVANQVEWGGEINDPRPTSPGPEMGCGRMASYNTQYSAFFKQVTVDIEKSKNVEPQDTKKGLIVRPYTMSWMKVISVIGVVSCIMEAIIYNILNPQ